MRDCRFVMTVAAKNKDILKNFLNILFDDVTVTSKEYDNYKHKISVGKENIYFNEEKFFMGHEVKNNVSLDDNKARITGYCDFSIAYSFLRGNTSNYELLKEDKDELSPYITCLEEQTIDKELRIDIMGENEIYGIYEHYIIDNGDFELNKSVIKEVDLPLIFEGV